VRPAHWKPFDDDLPNRDRTNQVLEWLRLPDAERPSFFTLYFSDVDSAGHSYGPESKEVLDAAARLDTEIGALVDGVNTLGLADRVHYVIVSDHGMSQNSAERVVVLDDYIDMNTVTMIDSSPVVGLWPKSGTVEDIYRALKDKHASLAVYRRAEVPAHLHYNNHPRIPPVIGIASDGWVVGSKARAEEWQSGARRLGGSHGYDPRLRSMHGFFVASGPQFRKGVAIPPLENIHLYSMMTRVLGLAPAPNDGRVEATAGVFEKR
jgi:predicted AlkP superfamily pyrophosphatase or phosphodiesterase